jgi:hypothetical protein
MAASVRVLLSHDFCHFEVSKSSDSELTDEQIDAMRKDCMRLADKAIRQYKIAKNAANTRMNRASERDRVSREVTLIEQKPEGDRTPNEMAKVKAFHDRNWADYISERYDYQDDWDDHDED